jgi:hypothetical protein
MVGTDLVTEAYDDRYSWGRAGGQGVITTGVPVVAKRQK